MTTTNMTIYACTDNCADHCTGQDDGWHSLRDVACGCGYDECDGTCTVWTAADEAEYLTSIGDM